MCVSTSNSRKDFRRIDVRFAMTTPWGVELQKNVLIFVHDDIFIIVGYNDLDRAFLFLGDRFGLDARLDLAVNKVLNESSDILLGQLLALVEGVFLVLDGLLDRKGGPFVDFEIQVTCVSAKGFGIDCCEADSTLVLLCDWLELDRELITLLWGFSEDVGEGNASLIFG